MAEAQEGAPTLPERVERRSWFTGRTRDEQIAYREEREDRRYEHNQRAIAVHRRMNYGRGPDDGDRDVSGGSMGAAAAAGIVGVPYWFWLINAIKAGAITAGITGWTFLFGVGILVPITIYIGGKLFRTYEPR